MTRAQRIGNFLGVFLPLGGLIAAVVLLWNSLVGPEALVIMAVLYLLTGLGISIGFHRLLAHRSFDARPSVRVVLAILGTMAMEGPVTKWVANHRKHHAFSDEDGDPHSPHLTDREGFVGAVTGLWHAHVGWILSGDRAAPERYAPDLMNDPVIAFVHRTSALWVVTGFVIPFVAGFAISGTAEGALMALLWGGAVRIFLLHHMTFAINSLCHFAGSRRFPTDDESRNVSWLAPLAFGEAWHNNHHAFPTSAFHGLRRWEIDPGGLVIRGLERLGLVWNVKRVSAERQQSKLTA